MKSKKQVLDEYPDYKTLINAVIKRIGIKSILNINSYGIQGGFSGFIFYYETHKFAMRHRKIIVKLLNEDADSIGEDVVSMVANFGIFRKNKMDNDNRQDLYKYIGGGKCEHGDITNLMAWYAAETVCRWFED